ncbi:hypothetical protein ACS0TY_033964 [Phlomoides rotata]
MNKFNFVRDGESKLPPGFRFQPTDEEIVFQYLAPKIFSYPLPASVIPEINMISTFELPGNMEEDRYFFAKREVDHHHHHHHHNVGRMIIRGSGGLWKCTSLDKKIIRCWKRIPIVGIKKTLVLLHKGKTPTNCFMHLFCCCIALPPNTIHHKGSFIQIGKWILCHVFMKKKEIRHLTYNGFARKELISSDTESSSSSSSSDSDSDSVFSEVSSGSETN